VAPTRGPTPRQSIEAECGRRGREAVIAGCIDLLEGRGADSGLVRSLGLAPADYVLGGGEGGPSGYWPRVWAARGLLHVWGDEATRAIVGATRDPAWRVREMAAKVVARHRVDEALEAVAALQEDGVARVRAAAHRALWQLTAGSGRDGQV